jgi:hypothetical protein
MAEEIEIIVTATGFDKVSSGLKTTTEALKSTATEAKKTGDTLKSNLNTGSTQAAQSLQNLSRIAQDAPFGFIGIANNINPLVESFGRLKAETGSTGGALKALVGGLSGAGGLGLAFGVVTAAISFAQIGFSAWTRSSKEAKESSDTFKLNLEDLKRQLNSVTDSLNNFIAAADNASKLNDINIVARFEDKTQQNTLIRQSRFITISEQLVETTDARRKAWQNYLDVARSAFKSDDEYAQAQKAAIDVYNQLLKKEKELTDARELQAATNRAATVEEQRAAAARATANAKRLADLDTIAKTLAKLKEDTKDQRQLAITFGTSTLQEQANLIKAAITKLVTVFNVDPNNKIILDLQTDLADINRKILREKVLAFVPAKLKFDDQIVLPLKNAKLINTKALDFTTLRAQILSSNLADIFSFLPRGFFKPFNFNSLDQVTGALEKALESSITTIGVGLGETLAAAITGTANFGNVFQGIFNQLGGVVSALGEQIIAIGAAALVAQAALSQIILNPFAAIAAGIALVALGSLIQSTTSRQNRFAVGTRNAPGGMALVGERGPEMISLPRGSQVLPAAQTANMLGGVGGAVEIYGILRGQDIYFSNKKYSATYARTT